jgi:uncharacterized protein YbaR (Trm112 family)/SAM-dependent methyltransferase
MKQILLPQLICPACLPDEVQLEASAKRIVEDDIVTGELYCKKCKQRFPIKDGIAILLPEPNSYSSGGQLRYEETGMTDRYLWSHYGDLLDIPEFGNANSQWAAGLSSHSPTASFDAGCSVGRIPFEMAARSKMAVGCDLSISFIKTARRLVRDRQLKFSLPMEGNLKEEFHIMLPESWRSDNVEFVVADALRVPFAAETFDQISSLNLIDRVNYPLAHLFEMNRVARKQFASFLFADPFSWSTNAAPEELWLGGTTVELYQGRGLDNVRALLEGKGKVLTPPWSISQKGAIPWKMRTHCNHHEIIRSEYLIAER